MSLSGTLASFVEGKGFGFVKRDDGEEDVFMHFSKLINGGSEDMVVGMGVCFDLERDERSGKMRVANATITSPGSGKPLDGRGSRGSVGEPSEVAVSGILKSFTDGKGFGFIQREDGKDDVFVHFSQLKGGGGPESMVVGMRVSFDVEPDERTSKLRATNVAIISQASGSVAGGSGSGFESEARQPFSGASVGGLRSEDQQFLPAEPARAMAERAFQEPDEERRVIPESDGGGTYTFSALRAAFTDYSDSDLRGYWRDVCKPLQTKAQTVAADVVRQAEVARQAEVEKARKADAVRREADAAKQAEAAQQREADDVAARHAEQLRQGQASHQMAFMPEKKFDFSSPITHASPMALSASPALGPTTFLPQSTTSFQSASFAERPSMLVSLPSMEQAIYLASAVGIAPRSGVQLSAERGPMGEAMLRIFGSPSEIAAACYLIQKAMWLNSVM